MVQYTTANSLSSNIINANGFIFGIMSGRKTIGLHEYLLFLEAWYFLAKARLMLVFQPFKKIIPTLRNSTKKNQGSVQQLEQIQLSIARACVRSPWRTKCFEQALAAKMMLKRRDIESTIFFGVRKADDGKNIHAHAWLKSGDIIITGWQKVDTYTVVGVF